VRGPCPDLPIIIVTGYVETSDVDGRIENAAVLKKPYRMNELAAAVEDTLRGQGRHEEASSVVPLRP